MQQNSHEGDSSQESHFFLHVASHRQKFLSPSVLLGCWPREEGLSTPHPFAVEIGREGWGHDCFHRGREPGQTGEVETRAVGSLATSLQLFLALLCLVL